VPEPSFDVVSVLDMQEVRNAVDQAQREIATRFDFKNTGTTVKLGEDKITLTSATDHRLEAAYQVLTEKLVRRKVSLKALDPGKIQPAAGGTVRQEIGLRSGIDKDHAREITKLVKDLKLKVQASFQGDHVRVTGKKKDDLQQAITAIKAADIDIPLQFKNMRG
jgi:uncharacterized protein YajQ (UPF0234 family)